MKSYGQYCGLARAAELLGERWTLVVVRDLLVGPRRFTDLREGIRGVPSNILTSRLRALEDAGVVERVLDGRQVTYRLTAYGSDLRPIVDALGLWGARRMDRPREGETPTPDSLASSLLATRTSERVEPFTVEVEAGPAVAHARVGSVGVDAAPGALPDADLRLGGPGLRRLLADGDAAARLAAGDVTAQGRIDLVEAFARAFRAPLDPEPAPPAEPL